MLCDYNGFSLCLQIADNIPEAVGGFDVQICGRLVHDIDLRLNGLSGGDGYLLPHSIGQCVQAVIQKVLNFIVLGCLEYMGLDFLMGISVIFTAESDFSGYLIGKKLTPGVLEHITYQLPAFPGVDFLQRFIPYTDLPAQLPLIEIGDQPIDYTGQRAFSASGWASQYDYFPSANVQCNMTDLIAPTTIRKCKIPNCDFFSHCDTPLQQNAAYDSSCSADQHEERVQR